MLVELRFLGGGGDGGRSSGLLLLGFDSVGRVLCVVGQEIERVHCRHCCEYPEKTKSVADAVAAPPP